MKQKFLGTFLAISALYLVLLMVPAKGKERIPFYTSGDSFNIAHRNGHALMPANTVEAGLYALEMGADILEIDLHLSADNYLIVRHDEIIDTTTDGVGRIEDLTLAEIEQYSAKFHEIEYPSKSSPLGIKIPTLSALFEGIPEARFLIEIKPQNLLASTRLCEVIRQYSMSEQVLVGSFHTSVLRHFRQVCPEVPTSHGRSEIQRFFVLAKLGLSHLFSPQGYSIQFPMFHKGWEVFSPQILKAAHQLNLKLEIWTINDQETFDKLIAMGVDGIITDRPDLLSQSLGLQ